MRSGVDGMQYRRRPQAIFVEDCDSNFFYEEGLNQGEIVCVAKAQLSVFAVLNFAVTTRSIDSTIKS